MNHDGAAFMNLKEKFGLFKSEAKPKRLFIGLEIGQLQLNHQLTGKLNSTELDAWKSCKLAIDNFMSLKLHFLHDQLNFFPPNLGAVSDEHGERFHQDIALFERR